MAEVFVSGGTGYLGTRMIAALLERGHRVASLVRAGSESKLPVGCVGVRANVLDPGSFRAAIPAGAVFVHLTGTPRPAPWKEREFRALDLPSLRASAEAAAGRVSHFIYVSVAQPAPVMRAYVAVRQEGEAILAGHGFPRTIIRPWYVLGPGHWWPYALLPLYALAERWSPSREAAIRLGLVTLKQMVRTLVTAVEAPPPVGARIVETAEIRAGA